MNNIKLYVTGFDLEGKKLFDRTEMMDPERLSETTFLSCLLVFYKKFPTINKLNMEFEGVMLQ